MTRPRETTAAHLRGLAARRPAALLLLLPAACGQPGPAVPAAPAFLVTAEQIGPVAYRDPLGALSPDGRWLAFTERDRVRVMPSGGGPVTVLGTGSASIRHLSWLPDSQRLAVQERVFDRSRSEWLVYDRADGSRARLWPGRRDEPAVGALRQVAWCADGFVAGVSSAADGSRLWVMRADGSEAMAVATGEHLSYPAWSPDGRLACLSEAGERQVVWFPAGDAGARWTDIEAYGPMAFSPGGDRLYFGTPGPDGFLYLAARDTGGGAPTTVARFARDTYAPSVSGDGQVVYKSQDYRVFLATCPADGGATTPLTTFQSETPSWSWDGETVAFTFGTWRHVTDDFHYPDIAQHLGLVSATAGRPHAEPQSVVRSSYSEDQGMHWSPNGRWIAFHTHVDSDDIWLMPADGSQPARMISENGSETGWPRWSSNGRWVVFPSYRRDARGARQAYLFVIGVDQDTGAVVAPQQRVAMPGFEHDIVQGEWLDDGDTLVFEAAEGIGRKSLWRVPRTGGAPQRFHAFSSEQVHSGIGVSPDGRWAAFVDRAPDGFFQIFRVPVAGGEPEQLTHDPSHKTQPSYAPRGERLAFTVFSYKVHFWSARGRSGRSR